MESILKRDFVVGIKNVAKVNFQKFYEKFVLSFENIEAMEVAINLLINVDDYYQAYRGAKKHFTQLFGYEDSEFELLYQINMIKDICTSLNMYDLLSSDKDFITWSN